MPAGVTTPAGLATNAADSLQLLQERFRSVYAESTGRALARLRKGSPALLVRIEDTMTLIGPEGSDCVSLGVLKYNVLKQVSHIAPMAVLLATAHADNRDELATVSALLDDLGVPAEAKSAGAVIDASRALLSAARTNGAREQDFATYREATVAAIESAARQAAKADLAALAGAMRTIEARVGLPLLRDAFFVVCGSHQSRRHELTRQFYRRWMSESFGERHPVGHRVVYAEDGHSVEDALKVVAARIVDAEIADALFADPTRLNEDILGKAAGHALAAIDSLRDYGAA